MSGAGGKWMASSVTEGHIKKLRNAGYLSSDIAHRLPDEGELIPIFTHAFFLTCPLLPP